MCQCGTFSTYGWDAGNTVTINRDPGLNVRYRHQRVTEVVQQQNFGFKLHPYYHMLQKYIIKQKIDKNQKTIVAFIDPEKTFRHDKLGVAV